MRPSITALAALAPGLALALPLGGQQRSAPQSDSGASGVSRHYFLPATPQNVQWGWYDPGEKPRLTLNSGDTVSTETISHSLGEISRAV